MIKLLLPAFCPIIAPRCRLMAPLRALWCGLLATFDRGTGQQRLGGKARILLASVHIF
jgi:hypothetical protein